MSGGDGQGPEVRQWTDEELKRAFLDEMHALVLQSPTVTAVMTPVEAWAVASNLQLALRHPSNRGPSAAIARAIALRIGQAVACGPATKEIFRRGWDAAYDLPLLP